MLGAVGLTNLQMAMTLSMVFVIYPNLEASFSGASPATLSWAINLFTIVGAATLVPGEALTRRAGARATLLTGTAAFTVASIGGALATSVGFLMVARIAQALASSLIVPAGAALVYREFPASKRGIAVTTSAAIGAVGAATGPALGGMLIDLGSWRWTFWLNVPLGILGFVVVRSVIDRDARDRSIRLPDGLGSLLMMLGMGALVLALVQSPGWGWTDARTLLSLGTGVALLVWLVTRSLHHPRPLLQLVLVGDRAFAQGTTGIMLFSVSFFGFLLISTLFLTDVWDLTIRRAGLLTAPIFAATALASITAGRLAARHGYRPVLVAGGGLWGCGTIAMALALGGEPSTSRWLACITVVGLGSGLLWGSMMAVSTATLPNASMAAGLSLSQTVQNLGSTLGIATAVTALGATTAGRLGSLPALWVASAIATAIAVAICARVADP